MFGGFSPTFSKKKRYRYPSNVIEWTVLFYLNHPNLSYRDVSLLLARLGLILTHKTIYEWVQKFSSDVQVKKIDWDVSKPWFLKEEVVFCNGERKIQYLVFSEKGELLMFLIRSRRITNHIQGIVQDILKDLYPAKSQDTLKMIGSPLELPLHSQSR